MDGIRRSYRDPGFCMGPVRVSDEVYEQAMRSFVIVCTDVVLYNRDRRVVYLAWRIILPMCGWWINGGRRFAGESREDAMLRHLANDIGLHIDPTRLQYLAQHEYGWRLRQQEPQETGSHCLADTFALAVSDEEISYAQYQLRSTEYDTRLGFRAFDLESMAREGVHEAMRDLYEQLFGSQHRY